MQYKEWKLSFQKLLHELYESSDSASFDEAYQEQRIITMKQLYPEYWERWKSEKH